MKKTLGLLPLQELVDAIQNKPIPAVPRLLPEPTASGTVESYDGTPIYWERHGPDPLTSNERPIVFCYGLVCSINQWRMQLERYSKIRPCVFLDYRGHHKSGVPESIAKMNLASCAKDVSAVVNHLQLKGPVDVWGHSMGCSVALEYALAEPDKVNQLVLLCGTANSPVDDMFHNPVLEKLLTEFFHNYPNNPQTYKFLWQVIRHFPQATDRISRLIGFNAQAATLQDIETYSLSVANIHPETFFPLIIELSKGLTFNILDRIKTPALVIAGALDRITPPDHQKRMAEGLPNGKYIEIPAGSHNVQIDFGEYVCMKVEEWSKGANDL